MELEELGKRLGRWADVHVGEGTVIEGVAPLPGNAGLSFGFRLARPHTLPEGCVIRLAPFGVRRQRTTDVLRQVPLLEALWQQHIPVARVRWSSDDPRWFGTDAFIVDWLDGEPLHMTDPSISTPLGPDGVGPLLEQAVDVLAEVHAVPWERIWPSEKPRGLVEEITWWSRLLERVREPSFSASADTLLAALMSTAHRSPRIGLCHGDYQTNNVLYRDERLVGVVDWELAGVGPQLLDLGWLGMMTDRRCWSEDYAAMLRVCAPLSDLVARYEAKSGEPVYDVEWYVALACFRFGAIVAFNTMLHRSGKRVDSFYEVLSRSLPCLFDRGCELIA